ncbi:hypothetical protein EH2_01211 [Bacillus subtilis]|nr:hypothetical protein EH2_01211 [Bacillus subtilis]
MTKTPHTECGVLFISTQKQGSVGFFALLSIGPLSGGPM